MTLRVRLLLVLVGVMAIGLVVSDVAVYSQLRSYLLAQVDPELRAVSRQVERVVLTRDGLIRRVPARTGIGAPESATSRSPTSRSPTSGSPTSVSQGGLRPPHSVSGTDRKGTHGGLVPSGTVGELVEADGRLVGSPVFFSYGGRTPPPPLLPHPLPLDARSGAVLFSARSGGPDAVTYRVLVRPLHSQGFAVAVAVPLTEVSQTLGRLALVMVLVSAAVLIGLGLLALWMVRQGLRPLDDMAVAAGAIAGGDLGRRVTPAGGRTEIGRLGEALNTMLTEIEDAFAARAASEGRLRRFLADASHELRTPLTSIQGYAEIFDLGARDNPEDLAIAMHRIREEAERMRVLVDDLLLLARLDRERPLVLAPMDLVPVVATAVAAARVASPDRDVLFEAPVEAVVRGDAQRLRQVVDNLLANAVQYSTGGVPVEVRLEPFEDAVLLEVTDHGVGIRPEHTERIFDAFFRADSSRARGAGGAGLGLAIVAAIVQKHGGEVGVRTAPDGGTVFWVRLPVDRVLSGAFEDADITGTTAPAVPETTTGNPQPSESECSGGSG